MVQIILTAALLIITTIWLIAVLRARDLSLPEKRRRMLRIWAAVQVVVFGLQVYGSWPYLPPALAQREVVAERFMTAVSLGDVDAAIAMTGIDDQTKLAKLHGDISDPANQPVRWELEEPNKSHFFLGTAIHPDGDKSDVLLGLSWEWPRARWAVVGVDIEDSASVNRIVAWGNTQFIPYNWIVVPLQLISLVSLFFVVRMARDERRWAGVG